MPWAAEAQVAAPRIRRTDRVASKRLRFLSKTEETRLLASYAPHVRPIAEGWVLGEARPISRGRTTQVWDIRITDEQGRLVCVSRCTMAVLARPSEY